MRPGVGGGGLGGGSWSAGSAGTNRDWGYEEKALWVMGDGFLDCELWRKWY